MQPILMKMNSIRRIGLGVVLLLQFQLSLKAQQDEITDSADVVDLSTAVITGQYSAQSIDKSIYQIEVISLDDIKGQAGNSVADVLSQTLNVLVTPNSQTGNSEVSIMGLDSGYTKVLVDNIPLISDSGLGTGIDLTKINLDNVERIEIVKGAMGVDYGNNALAGVINIITKKSISQKWKITAFLQEETVGGEYDWYGNKNPTKGKGRHIQSLEVSHKISDKWFISAGFNRNDFQGYWGNRKGGKYFRQDSLRGYEWLPKEQINTNGLLSYRTRNFNAFYKFNYLNEQINYYDQMVSEQPLGGNERTFVSQNIDYRTNRWLHQLNINTKLFDRIRYIADFSYQKQERQFRDYLYNIPERTDFTHPDYSVFASSKALYARGTFSNFIDYDWIDFQLGYELDHTEGFRSRISGLFPKDISNTIKNYAGFVSAELKTDVGLSFRPGYRAVFSNKFERQSNYSLSTKYDVSHTTDVRLVAGTANRYPNFDELYTYFVDSNHDIRGNENLKPEKGYSVALQWNNKINHQKFRMSYNLSTIYIDNDDRIELAVINYSPLQNKYINIDKYRAWGISTADRFIFNRFDFSVGASLLGVSKRLATVMDKKPNEDFRYTFEANLSANYKVPKWNTTFSVYYKHSGKQTEYVLENDLVNGPFYRLGERGAFNLLNFSMRKNFFDNALEISLGARNLFDISSVKNTTIASSLHSANTGEQAMFYGRSYFIKLIYNLNFK